MPFDVKNGLNSHNLRIYNFKEIVGDLNMRLERENKKEE
jgi:hypothetical protein